QDTIDELSKRGYDTSGFTAHELATGFVVFGSSLAVVGIAAILAAVFVLRRSRGARIVLTALSAITIALSLVGIASVLSLITLVGAIVTVVLLFRRSSNAWFARRPQQPPYPPSYPPTYPPNHPGSPWTGA
ncbi:MAG TPA: hypothetical protein VFR99_12725, partial [Marmoricola sp.]|nr:hypothetical protein [Marmoricola sp.]